MRRDGQYQKYKKPKREAWDLAFLCYNQIFDIQSDYGLIELSVSASGKKKLFDFLKKVGMRRDGLYQKSKKPEREPWDLAFFWYNQISDIQSHYGLIELLVRASGK